MACQVCIVGGGAAGFWAAITAADILRAAGRTSARVTILEKTGKLLHKVRISGGGRCNVTTALREPTELAARYPRGRKLLSKVTALFNPEDTVQWFQRRGVELKTEADGRMFPVSNSSETVATCLEQAAAEAIDCERLILCPGSVQKRSVQQLLADVGHDVQPPVPSLFAFHLDLDGALLSGLAGLTVPETQLQVMHPEAQSKEAYSCGPLLITHQGITGPAVLRLSAFGARWMQQCGYCFPIQVNWAPFVCGLDDCTSAITAVPEGRDRRTPVRRKQIGDVSPWGERLPSRLWRRLLSLAGADAIAEQRWSKMSDPDKAADLAKIVMPAITSHHLKVCGRSLNKQEFVTAGGIYLSDVDWSSMASTKSSHVYFAGEVLDADGLTGGFNFQLCWSTAFLAGRSAAASLL